MVGMGDRRVLDVGGRHDANHEGVNEVEMNAYHRAGGIYIVVGAAPVELTYIARLPAFRGSDHVHSPRYRSSTAIIRRQEDDSRTNGSNYQEWVKILQYCTGIENTMSPAHKSGT